MALAFNLVRTFFRGIKQVQTNTYPFIDKEKGKRLGKDPQRSGKIIANQYCY